MGNICSCSTGTPKPVDLTESELALVIKVQAHIRGKLSRMHSKSLKGRIESVSVFCKQSISFLTVTLRRGYSERSHRGARESVSHVQDP